MNAIVSHFRISHMNKAEFDKILADSKDKDPNKATDLRGKALLRARDNKIPRTMTPYEWLEYYESHGVPKEHRQSKDQKSWWDRIKRLIGMY